MKRKNTKNSNEKIIKKKAIALSEAFIMILSSFAFAFIVGGMVIGVSVSAIEEAEATSASDWIPTGCCLEANNGNKCQDLNTADSSLCKTDLIATECNLVDDCKRGCCYNPRLGQCSLNSPQSICLENEGNWSSNAQCNIPECSIGCCILGDQASITTTRECTRLSQQLNFQKVFLALDADGTCNSKTNLDVKGACTTPSSDYSGKNDCRFTTKGACKTGTFYENYLCTSKELNTNCKHSKNTTCLPDRDQVYYLDSCGNTANVYDASKFDKDNYWDHIIPPSSGAVCQTPNSECGNCDYMEGSVCGEYREGRDSVPKYGNNVCRDLNCENGRHHGESWCVYDTNPNAVFPVGGRHFLASCMEGEISIQGCADFNQEVCAENTDETNGLTEARCFTNDWRSCIAANQKASYALVKVACDDNPQCVMLDSRYGANNVKRSDGQYLAGFKTDVLNIYQGSAGSIGTSQNLYPAHCVPKYTPGFQFWTSSNSSASYGGSTAETNTMCSTANFVCVSNMERECDLDCIIGAATNPNCDAWEDKYNWECNINGARATIRGQDLPKLMAAMNERCRSIGSCGISNNIAGETNTVTGSNSFSVARILVDAEGDNNNVSIVGYTLSQSYLNSISSATRRISSSAELTRENSILGTGDVDSGQSNAANPSGTSINLATLIAGLDIGDEYTEDLGQMGDIINVASAIIGLAVIKDLGLGSAIMNILGSVTDGINSVLSAMGRGVSQATASAAANTVGSSAGGPLGTGGAAPGGPSGNAARLPPSGGGQTPTSTSGSGNYAGGALVGAVIGYVVSYYVGNLILNNQHWSPGRQAAFMKVLTAFGAMAGAIVGIAVVVEGGLVGCVAGPIGCLITLVIAILAYVYTSCFDSDYTDKQYYVLSYQCKAWEPPDDGDCSLCNNDVRPCSEYRCRSLGDNCQYYNSNGEPGYCAELSETWSATITPWQEALSEGLKYSEVRSNGFKIESTASGSNGRVHAWENLEFGIETNEPAQCKLDIVHTTTFDEMAYDFEISQESGQGCISGSCTQGTMHSIVISPHASAGGGTPPLIKNAENNYYIRCRNFAGQTNAGEFAVKIIADNGEDLTPPIITRFSPASDSYVKLEENSSRVSFYVNEPSTCRYSAETDNRFEDMDGNVSCLTNPNMGFRGEWACSVLLEGIKTGDNKFYFQCQDKPKAPATERKNINRNSKEYTLKGCSVGLNITKLYPQNIVIAGKSPVSLSIGAETSGCVNNGRAVCEYSFGNNLVNSSGITFFNTDSRVHKQTFTSMPGGNHTLGIKCKDDAGNIAYGNLNLNVYIDDNPPVIARTYIYDRKLNIITDEKAECKFTNNASIGCDFEYGKGNNSVDNSPALLTIMPSSSTGKAHYTDYNDNEEYYIKCKDIFGNTNADCAIIIKTV